MNRRRDLPLVYSCSGCSSAAQMTNWIAVQLDRRGVAEMSCIAGVGGDVPSLVRKARGDRPVIAVDGCVLQCARSCLARQGVTPAVHHLLSDDGVRKRLGEDFDPEQAEQVLDGLIARIGKEIGGVPEPVGPVRPPAPVEPVEESAGR
ncbi:putative zinc-binding protein [Streptomyces sp. NPDC006967]|uniref:putative zinc-binding protein n=1 Tax=unclassified Streptomyces TaxID=2593676 RepID=UPI0027E5BC82|nr:putative zinc-binding protein [Streptomyces sp. SM1]